MNDITGRDGFIEGQALVYAIASIQSLPKEKQEFSNMWDMVRIVRATTSPEMLAVLARSVETHTGRMPSLFGIDGDEHGNTEYMRAFLDMYQQLSAPCPSVLNFALPGPDSATLIEADAGSTIH